MAVANSRNHNAARSVDRWHPAYQANRCDDCDACSRLLHGRAALTRQARHPLFAACQSSSCRCILGQYAVLSVTNWSGASIKVSWVFPPEKIPTETLIGIKALREARAAVAISPDSSTFTMTFLSMEEGEAPARPSQWRWKVKDNGPVFDLENESGATAS